MKEVNKLRFLSIDIETFSSVNLLKSDVYPYVESFDFEILLLAYAFDDEEVNIIDLKNNEEVPRLFLDSLDDPKIIKTAFNANFERVCLSKYFNINLPIEQWRCTAAQSHLLSLPNTLEGVAKALNLNINKLENGRDLINKFCIPKGNYFYDYYDNEWEEFKNYCKNDVEVERAIRKKLTKYPINDFELKVYEIDQIINDRGISVDINLLNNAIEYYKSAKNKLEAEFIKLTGINNVNSHVRLKEYFKKKGYFIDSVSKENIFKLYNEINDEEVKRVIKIKESLGKSSVKKYDAIKRVLCSDNRIRGMFKYYGASRTGRWSGRLVQLQNMPRVTLENFHEVRDKLKKGSLHSIIKSSDEIIEYLSQCIRSTFVPEQGKKFIILDYESIEARILSYIADEKWRNDVFNGDGKIYEACAANMFDVPVENIKGDSLLRNIGKLTELSLGYGGGSNALTIMGALKYNLTEGDLIKLVYKWRKANPKIVKLWEDTEKAFVKAFKNKNTDIKLAKGISLFCSNNNIFINLPSGRSLCYLDVKLYENILYDKTLITYLDYKKGSNDKNKSKTYGGKLVENIVQGIARDILAEALIKLESNGFKVVMHVHDEVVVEINEDESFEKRVYEVKKIMEEEINWCLGLTLKTKAKV